MTQIKQLCTLSCGRSQAQSRATCFKEQHVIKMQEMNLLQWFNQAVRCGVALIHKPADGMLLLDWMFSFMASHRTQNSLLAVCPTSHSQKVQEHTGKWIPLCDQQVNHCLETNGCARSNVPNPIWFQIKEETSNPRTSKTQQLSIIFSPLFNDRKLLIVFRVQQQMRALFWPQIIPENLKCSEAVTNLPANINTNTSTHVNSKLSFHHQPCSRDCASKQGFLNRRVGMHTRGGYPVCTPDLKLREPFSRQSP